MNIEASSEIHSTVFKQSLEKIEEIRSQVVDTSLLACAVLGLPAVAASLFRALDIGWQPIMGLHLVIYSVVLASTIFRGRFSYHVRGSALLAVFFIAGGAGLYSWGLFGGGGTIFVTFTFLASILFGLRVGIAAMVSSLAVMSTIAVGVQTGAVPLRFDPAAYATAPSSWVLLLIGFILIGTIILFSLKRVQSAFLSSIRALDIRGGELEQLIAQLEREFKYSKQLEQQVFASQQKMRAVLDIIPSTISLRDRDGRFLVVNKAQGKLHGVHPRDMVGTNTNQLDSGSESEKFKWIDQDRQVMKSGQTLETEQMEFTTLEGESTFRRMVKMPFLDEQGVIQGVVTTSEDITESVWLKKDLLESHERHQAIFNSAVDGIITIDENGLIDSFNPAAEKLFGYSLEEVLGKNVRMLMPESYRDTHENSLRRFLNTGEKKIMGIGTEVEALHKDGTRIPIELSVSEIRLGDRQLFTSVIRDISERREAGKRIAENETLLRMVLESMPGGILVINNDVELELFNHQYIEMFGFPESLMKPGTSLAVGIRNLAERGEFGEGEVEDIVETRMNEFRQALVNPTVSNLREFRLKNGKALEIQFAQAKQGMLIGVIIDITERVSLEENLRASHDRNQAVLNSALDGIITIDERGLIDSFNPAAESIFGYEPNEVIGQNVKMLMPDPDRKNHDSYISGYLKTGDSKIIGSGREVTGKRKNGSTFPMDLAISEFLVGNQRMFTGITRDITERKEAEEKIKESEARSRELLESSPIGISIVLSGRRLYTNPRFNEMFSGDSSNSLSDMDVANTWVNLKDLEEVRRIGAETGYNYEMEDFRQRLDGSKFWCLRSVRPADSWSKGAYMVWHWDITDRKEAEDVIAKQNSQMEIILNNMGQGISLVDADLNIVEYNQMGVDVLGLAEAGVEKGQPLEDVFRFNAERGDYGPGDVEHQVQERLELARKFEPHIFERTRPDGTVIEVRGDPVPAGGMVTTYTDITERKNSEAAIRESEVRFQLLMEASPIGTVMVSGDGTLIYTNARNAKMFGTTKENLLGGKVRDFYFNPKERDKISKQLKRDGHIRDLEVHLKREDGSPFWALLTLEPTEIEGENTDFGWIYDITERKEAEERLKASESKTRALLDNSPIGISIVSHESGRRIYTNPRFNEMFSGDPNHSMTSLDTGETWANLNDLEEVARTVAEKGFNHEAEGLRKRLDGSEWWCLHSFRPANFWGEGAYMVWHWDITERKQAEEAVKEAEVRLTDAIEVLPLSFMLWDAEEKLIKYNQKALEYSSEQGSYIKLNGTFQDMINGLISNGIAQFGDLTEEQWFENTYDAFKTGGSFERVNKDGRTFISTYRPTSEGGTVNIRMDITDRIQAEEAVRESEARFQTVMDNMPALVYLRDLKGRFLIMNQKYRDTFQIDDTDIFKININELLPIEEAKNFLSEDRTVLESDQVKEFETIVERNNLTKIFSSVKFPIHDLSGNIKAIGGIDIDITERKQADEILHQRTEELEVTNQSLNMSQLAALNLTQDSHAQRMRAEEALNALKKSQEAVELAEARMREAIENISEGFVVFDAEDRLLISNDQYRNMFPLIAHKIIPGIRYEELLNEAIETEESGIQENINISEWKKSRLDHHRNADGSSFFFKLYDGRWVKSTERKTETGSIVGIRTDVTELTLAREEAEKAEDLLRDAIENISDGFVVYDADDRMVLCNDEFKNIFPLAADLFVPGVPIEEILDAQLNRGQYDLENRTAMEWKQERLRLFRERTGQDHVLQLEDGRWIQSRDRKTASGGFVGIRTDITDLTQARKEAEAATEAKSSFLAAMSHEIRTPMNGVVGMIDLLRQSELDSDQRAMTRTIRDSAFALLHIINDILDFSKIEAGKMELEIIPVSIRDIVEGVTETLLPNAAKKDVRLSIYVDPDIPALVMGDSVRLRQILFNLAGNAIKFTEKRNGKQGEVTIRTERVPSGTKKNHKIRLSVSDTGIGMPTSVIENLFKTYSQADASTTRRFGGTGLGLSICKNLTELMEGEIEVESTESVGSTFTVTLPLKTARIKRIDHEDVDLKGLRVLVVIRGDEMRKSVLRYLDHWKAKPQTIDDIKEIEPKIISAKNSRKIFHVVVIGPEWGKELRDKSVISLREEPKTAGLRFVLLSDDRTEHSGMVLPDTMMVHSAPLLRSAFIRGVATAVGRASPEVIEESSDVGMQSRKTPTIQEAESKGQLILVAEDNLTNQDVIRRQLNMLGYAAEIAFDGKEALVAWRSGRFGILLSDVHMPEMDGFQLSAEIRKAEKNKKIRFPIIAITANALQGEAEKCLAAGMDDYLAKPLEMDKLKKKLALWMPKSTVQISRKSSTVRKKQIVKKRVSQKKDNGSKQPIDPSALTSVFGNDLGTVREILNEFIPAASANLKEIEDAYADRSAMGIGAASHKLKSSARTVGAHELADLCQELEQAGKLENWKTLDEEIPRLEGIFKSIIEYIHIL